MDGLDQVPETPLTTPLDDASLAILREALDSAVTEIHDDGSREYSGEFTLNQLLEFWSGISDTDYKSLGLAPDPITGEHEVEWLECTKPMLSEKDVIRDLIDEITRLRKAT